MSEFNPEEHLREEMEVAGFPIRVTSYKLGRTFHCMVDNVSPGAIIARTSGEDRDRVVRDAIDLATARLESSARRLEAVRKLRAKD